MCKNALNKINIKCDFFFEKTNITTMTVSLLIHISLICKMLRGMANLQNWVNRLTIQFNMIRSLAGHGSG